MASAKKTVMLVQVSDAHLRKEEDGALLGMNTRNSLDAVLDLVKTHHGAPDAVIASGDLAQDGSIEAYECFQAKMAQFSCPVYWFNGNHDDREVMAEVASRTDSLTSVQRVGEWQIILLDSLVRGKVYGRLSDHELKILDDALTASPGVPTLVSFHHHPIDIGCRWLDNIGLKNRDALFEIIDRHPQVKVLLWGHIHQEVDTVRNGVRLLASPSTCVQFLPHSDDFAIDTIAPGYRWLKLHADGTVDTGVLRADHIEFQVDYSSKGY
ncbi:MAG: 3',5'-cyclic-AMP phosphodiesterase [Hahellaceae bacterium]|nr:3',5'-cyclic-AMP phosphodiesterase [Hahellaceae bacterium]MCP5168657.1 3',5'-cyclic-AMP phosphodiesterase [Hahellaceae bacterium]